MAEKHSEIRESYLVTLLLVSKSKFVTNLMTKSIHQDAPHKNDLKTKIKINERSPDILPRSSSQLLKYSTNPE